MTSINYHVDIILALAALYVNIPLISVAHGINYSPANFLSKRAAAGFDCPIRSSM